MKNTGGINVSKIVSNNIFNKTVVSEISCPNMKLNAKKFWTI